MSHPGPVAEICGRLVYEFTQIQPMLPTYLHVILAALFPIYAASHASLSRPSSAAKRGKKTKDGDETDGEESDDEYQRMEGLSPKDALLFPLMAGATLGALYFLIKYLESPELLNRILNWYFAVVGLYGVCKFISDGLHIVHLFVYPSFYSDGVNIWQVNQSTRKALRLNCEGGTKERTTPLPGLLALVPLPARVNSCLWTLRDLPSKKVTVKFYIHRIVAFRTHVDPYSAMGVLFGTAAVIIFNLVAKPWYLTNLMGFAFSYSALQLMSPTTFGTGSLVLCGLFFYDVYMVFFTPLMVTVAKSLDIPIKLLFPRPAPAGEAPGKPQFAMLGLGDIVLPGMVMGLALRFDLYVHYLRKQRKTTPQSDTKSESKSSMSEYVSPSKHWSNHFWTSSRFRVQSLESNAINDGQFAKTYFNASLVGYFLGMLTTLGAMHLSAHPQPALLYLVPGVLLSLWLTALVRGDLKLMWEFTEAEEDDVDSKVEDGVKQEKVSTKSIFSQKSQLKREEALKRVAERIIEKCDSDSEDYEMENSNQAKKKSQAKVEKLEHAFRRDKNKDLIFFSVSSYRPFRRKAAKKNNSQDGEPKWVAPVKEHSSGEPAEKRLRTA
jgi:minor histocompatibility antigen H13